MPDKLFWCGDGDDGRYLSDQPDDPESRPVALLSLALDEMAQYLDQTAEDINAHAFCGAHQALADLLLKTVGPTRSRRVMANLVRVNGLHGMTGVAGAEPGPVEAARILDLDISKANHW